MGKWMGPLPDRCDFCGEALKNRFVDGKTVYGPWGILCQNCHKAIGVGLGLGKGQMYDLKTLEKIRG